MRKEIKMKGFGLSIACIGIVWVILSIMDRQHHEQIVQEMLQPSSAASHAVVEMNSDDGKQLEKFWGLWQERDKRDIGAELTPLLTSTSQLVRHNSLRACMLLESPACEVPLEKIIAHPPNIAGFAEISPIEYQLALGRIQARDKKGKVKLDAFLGPTGLKWEDAVAISKKVNSLGGYLHYSGSKGDVMVPYLVEMIHDMQRKGDNVELQSSQLLLMPSQKVMLKGSLLSVEEEANLIINHALSIPTYDRGSRVLMEQTFPRLGSKATNILLAKLQDIADHPEKYPDTKYGTRRYALMRAAVAIHDNRFIAVFKKLENGANGRVAFKVRHELKRLRMALNTGWYPDL